MRSNARNRRPSSALVVLAVLVLLPAAAHATGKPNLLSTSPRAASSVRSDQVPFINATYDRELSAPPLSTVQVHAPDGILVQGSVALCDPATSSGGKRGLCFTPSSPLKEAKGTYRVSLTARTPSSNEASSETFSFTVDDTPPAAPVITSPVSGKTVLNRVKFIGKAEPSSLIVLAGWPGGGSARTNVYGDWTTTVTIADGVYAITATAVDAAGNTSVASAPVDITVDGTPPPTPTIDAPVPDSVVTTPAVGLTGTGEPGSNVVLFEGGLALGSAPVESSGTWSVSLALAYGPHSVTARGTDTAGNTSAFTDPVSFVFDPRNGVPLIDRPLAGARLNVSTVTIAGRARPGWTVRLSAGSLLIGETAADAGGRWSVVHPFPEGTHTIEARGVEPSSGTVSDAETRTFLVDTTPPDAPVITSPANGTLRAGAITITGTSAPFANITVAVDDEPQDPIAAGNTGSWSTTVTIGDGDHTIVAFAADDAGNSSGPSASVQIVADGTRPTVRFITPDRSIVLPGGAVEGRADDERLIGKVLVRYIDVRQVTVHSSFAALVVDADGRGATWRSSAPPIAPGVYRVAAQAIDAMNNYSDVATITIVKTA